jgi:uncharacterized protein YbaP (TraB family)
MNLRLLFLLVGFLAGLAPVQAQSSVWKITKGAKVLYLGGTCHVLRPADFPLPPEYDVAYAASTEVVFETDLGHAQSAGTQLTLATKGMFTDGTTLQKVLTPEAWKASEAWCATAGLPIEAVSNLKPWFFTVMIEALELQKLGVSEQGVDLHFYQLAAADKKKTGELETLETQIDLMTGLGAGHESELVTSSLEDLDKLPKVLNDMIAAWRGGDLAKLDELMNRDIRDKFPVIYHDLILQRNQTWEPKIEAMLQTPEPVLVLVGAGHLPGPDGLLTQLGKHGCTVEQIKAPAVKKAGAPNPPPPPAPVQPGAGVLNR